MMNRREAIERMALALGASLCSPAIARAAAEAIASGDGYAPRALTPRQLEQVATIADGIIPRTDTPGARDAGVHRFIDTMLAEYYTGPERERFIAGLDAIRQSKDPRAALEQLDREGHDPFFRMMKELTILGYYTSQPGATKELHYVQVPGRYDGCVPFPPNGRAWAV
jgi:hypothetical protein